MAQTVKRLSRAQETQVRSLGQEDPLEKEWQSTPVLLPEKSHGQRRLVGYSPWGRKESDTTERRSCSWNKVHHQNYKQETWVIIFINNNKLYIIPAVIIPLIYIFFSEHS